jgi:hypothetical protein
MRLVTPGDSAPTATTRTKFILHANISSVTQPDFWVFEHFGVWVFKVRTNAVLVDTTFTVYDYPNPFPLPGYRAHVLTGSTDLIQSFTGGPGTGQTTYTLSGAIISGDRKIEFRVAYGTTRAIEINFGVQIDDSLWGEVEGVHGTTKLWSCESGLNSQVPLPRFLTVKQDGTRSWASTVVRLSTPSTPPRMECEFSIVGNLADLLWIGTPLARGHAFLTYLFTDALGTGPMLGTLMDKGSLGGYFNDPLPIMKDGVMIGRVFRRANPAPLSYPVRHVDDLPSAFQVNYQPTLDNGAIVLVTVSRTATVQVGTIFKIDPDLPSVTVNMGCMRVGTFVPFAGSLILPSGVESKTFAVFWPVLEPQSLSYSGQRANVHALFSSNEADKTCAIENGTYRTTALGSFPVSPSLNFHWPFAGYMTDETEAALDATTHQHPHLAP